MRSEAYTIVAAVAFALLLLITGLFASLFPARHDEASIEPAQHASIIMRCGRPRMVVLGDGHDTRILHWSEIRRDSDLSRIFSAALKTRRDMGCGATLSEAAGDVQ